VQKELEGFGIRLNQKPANIVFKTKERGGINLTINGVPSLTHLDKNLITNILKEYRIMNADITMRCDATVDQFIGLHRPPPSSSRLFSVLTSGVMVWCVA
jgi:ribosome-interacting GTPase 1